jgi:hypothetical protein
MGRQESRRVKPPVCRAHGKGEWLVPGSARVSLLAAPGRNSLEKIVVLANSARTKTEESPDQESKLGAQNRRGSPAQPRETMREYYTLERKEINKREPVARKR